MLIEIEFDSEIAIYEQLRRQIIMAIAKGELESGYRLPSIRQLGEELGINFHTVNKSYNLLKDEGYLIIDRRVGAMVADNFNLGNKNFKKNIIREMKYIIADSKNRGISKEEFIKFCESFYDEYNGKNNK